MALTLVCDICGDEFYDHNPDLKHCRSCQYILNKYKKSKRYNYVSVRSALKRAFSHKKADNLYFTCEYTGIISTFDKQNDAIGHFNDPFVLTLDHLYSKQDSIVVCLNLVNKMKGDIPPAEFEHIVIALGEFFRNEDEDKTMASKKLEDKLKKICVISQE
jgi:hypothetical protein